MRKLFICLLMGLLLAAPLGAASSAQAGKGWGVDLDVTTMSRYVWRGMVGTDGWVLQPSVTGSVDLGPGSLSGNIWLNVDLSDVNERSGEATEIDYTIDYTISLGDLSIPIGAIYYDFPGSDADGTTEIYAGVAYTIGPATPNLTVYRDIDEIEGTYVSLGLDLSFDLQFLTKDLQATLDLSGKLGWGDSDYVEGYFGVDQDAMTDLTFSISMPAVVGNLTITPSVSYSTLVDSEIRDAVTQRDNNWWGGCSFTYSF